jgi:hypothetical protein
LAGLSFLDFYFRKVTPSAVDRDDCLFAAEFCLHVRRVRGLGVWAALIGRTLAEGFVEFMDRGGRGRARKERNSHNLINPFKK